MRQAQSILKILELAQQLKQKIIDTNLSSCPFPGGGIVTSHVIAFKNRRPPLVKKGTVNTANKFSGTGTVDTANKSSGRDRYSKYRI